MATTPPKNNRYQVPDAEKEPDFDLQEEAEESREVRPDLEEAEAAKGETSPADTEYGGLVSKYFNEKRHIVELTGAEDTELFENDRFLAEQQRSLEKLANPKTAKELLPRDVALPLADIAGEMTAHNPETPGLLTGNEAADLATEGQYRESKKVFMESCKKVYPGVEVNAKNFGADLKDTVGRLSREADNELIPDLSDEQIQELYENDPQTLVGRLDEVLHQSGDELQSRGRIGFDNADPTKRREISGDLAAATEMFYKLQLLRDALREKMYGRKDVTVKEAGEIDRMRKAFGGKETADRDQGTEAVAAKPGEAETPLDVIDAAIEQEKTREAKAEKEEIEADKLLLEPTKKALREVWHADGPFADRLSHVAERIDHLADLKLDAQQKLTVDQAYRFSMRQIFADLLPSEKKALAEVARQEQERRRVEVRTGADKAKVKPLSAEKLFVDLMSAVFKPRLEKRNELPPEQA